MLFDFQIDAFLHLPAYLKNLNYTSSTDPVNSNWKFAKGSDMISFLQ